MALAPFSSYTMCALRVLKCLGVLENEYFNFASKFCLNHNSTGYLRIKLYSLSWNICMSTKLSYASFTLNVLIRPFCINERKTNNIEWQSKFSCVRVTDLPLCAGWGFWTKKDEVCKYENNNHLIKLIMKECTVYIHASAFCHNYYPSPSLSQDLGLQLFSLNSPWWPFELITMASSVSIPKTC